MSGLGQQTGGDADSRLTEAKRLLEIIGEGNDSLTDWERQFLADQRQWVLELGRPPSGKVIFKLRDLRDRCL